jgi:hypothetical protein
MQKFNKIQYKLSGIVSVNYISGLTREYKCRSAGEKSTELIGKRQRIALTQCINYDCFINRSCPLN